MIISQNWKDIESNLARQLLNGTVIKTQKWQGVSTPAPMLEKLFLAFQFAIPENQQLLQNNVSPNIPWAEDHFQERVAGVPVNPGFQYQNWPHYKHDPSNDTFRTSPETPCSKCKGNNKNCDACLGSGIFNRLPNQFSHTYMERFWTPKFEGIRYEYGNLQDVITLLHKEPDTRQAFLPVWFPEDTGAVHGGRVPCTIGYHFLLRGGFLHCTYSIRSCDYFRHLRDDVYLAGRLVQWVIGEAFGKNTQVKPGFLVMHIASLHCWESERFMLEKGY